MTVTENNRHLSGEFENGILGNQKSIMCENIERVNPFYSVQHTCKIHHEMCVGVVYSYSCTPATKKPYIISKQTAHSSKQPIVGVD